MFAICLLNYFCILIYGTPRYLKSVTCSIKLSFIRTVTLCMWFPHIAIDFVFVLGIVILCWVWSFCAGYGHFVVAIRFKWYAIVCNSSSDVAIKIWSSAYSMVFTNFLFFSSKTFFISVLNSCTILLMYILNNTGDRPHPCLTPLFVCIGSDKLSLNLILTFVYLKIHFTVFSR